MASARSICRLWWAGWGGEGLKQMWTAEKVRALSQSEVKTLRENALKRGAQEIVALCDAALLPLNLKPKKELKKANKGDFVAGYHFVCSGDRGVIDNRDGTFWTGSWVVACKNVDESLRFGAYLALHETKDQPSYRHGDILEYRLRERDMIDKDNVGVEFKVKASGNPRLWAGGGSGEKGYLWRTANGAPSS